MKKFNKQSFEILGREIDDALRVIVEKHKIALARSGFRYDVSGMSCSLRIDAEINEDSPEKQQQLIRHLDWLGLPHDIIGKTITSRGKEYEITGVNPKKPKFAVITKDSLGRRVFFAIEPVRVQFPGAKNAYERLRERNLTKEMTDMPGG